MILHLSGEVNYEMFDTLTRAFNSLTLGDKLHIYFTSEGGLLDVAEAMIDFFNKNKDYIGITFYGEVFSAAMIIFLRVKCDKWLVKGTTGMYHFAWQEMTLSEGGKPSEAYDIFSLKEMKRTKTRTLEYLTTIPITQKEFNSIKRGKDVYFSYERMLDLLNGTKPE